MSTLQIKSDEWNAVYQKLKALPKELQSTILEQAATEVGIYISSVAKDTYPPAPRRKRVYESWTAKQKRWWWWVMSNLARNGGVDLPSKTRQQFIGYKAQYRTIDGVRKLDIEGSYARTNGLVRSLDYTVSQGSGYVQVGYGSNVPYAPYVIGDDDEQSEYHKGNWKQLLELITENLTPISTIFADAVEKRINDYLDTDTGGK